MSTIAPPLPPLIFVASPYAHPSEELRAWRGQMARTILKHYTRLGILAYVPIAYAAGLEPMGHEFWMPLNDRILCSSRHMVVAELPGWENSRGIAHEMRVAAAARIPILYLPYSTIRKDILGEAPSE